LPDWLNTELFTRDSEWEIRRSGVYQYSF